MAEIDQTAILSELSGVKQSISGLTARLDANLERNRDEIDALFTVRSDHEKRIGKIERDYVPNQSCAHLHQENRERIEKAEEDITGLRISVARITTWVVLVSAIANVAITALLRYVWH